MKTINLSNRLDRDTYLGFVKYLQNDISNEVWFTVFKPLSFILGGNLEIILYDQLLLKNEDY